MRPLLHPSRRRLRVGGFTLVELVCTLAIIAGLLTFAAWNYRTQAQRNRGRSCGLQLQQIEDAKAKFRVDFPGTALPSDPNDENGIRRYFTGGRIPTCPAGGSYANVTSGSSLCACSLNVTSRYSDLLNGTYDDLVTKVEMRAARDADAADPNEGGDRSANGFHDLGYAPDATPTPTPRP